MNDIHLANIIYDAHIIFSYSSQCHPIIYNYSGLCLNFATGKHQFTDSNPVLKVLKMGPIP